MIASKASLCEAYNFHITAKHQTVGHLWIVRYSLTLHRFYFILFRRNLFTIISVNSLSVFWSQNQFQTPTTFHTGYHSRRFRSFRCLNMNLQQRLVSWIIWYPIFSIALLISESQLIPSQRNRLSLNSTSFYI